MQTAKKEFEFYEEWSSSWSLTWKATKSWLRLSRVSLLTIMAGLFWWIERPRLLKQIEPGNWEEFPTASEIMAKEGHSPPENFLM